MAASKGLKGVKAQLKAAKAAVGKKDYLEATRICQVCVASIQSDGGFIINGLLPVLWKKKLSYSPCVYAHNYKTAWLIIE